VHEPLDARKPNTDLHQDAMTETLVMMDKKAARRSSGGQWLLVRPLAERGEGGKPILGNPDPGLSPETGGDSLL
jgi:hypothetical protein